MARARFITLLVGLLCLPVAVKAVSLDGMLIYSTDDVGNPVGFDWDSGQVQSGIRLWQTQSHPFWAGLGVLMGLPPESLRTEPINASDFTVSTPLSEGENDFTLVGECGVYDFQSLAINLFFDGNLEYPSISVLIPANSPLNGSAPAPNRSDVVLRIAQYQPGSAVPHSTLAAESLSMAPETTYTDGTDTVSVGAASFVLDPSLDVNIVSHHASVGDSTKNCVGVLKLLVEAPTPVSVLPPGGAVPLLGGVNIGQGVRVGPDLSGGPGAPSGAQGRGDTTGAGVPRGGLEPGSRGLGATPVPENSPPVTTPSEGPTADTSAPVTTTPGANPPSTIGPTSRAAGTPTPAGTPARSSPTAQASPSNDRTATAPNVGATPTPAVRSRGAV